MSIIRPIGPSIEMKVNGVVAFVGREMITGDRLKRRCSDCKTDVVDEKVTSIDSYRFHFFFLNHCHHFQLHNKTILLENQN